MVKMRLRIRESGAHGGGCFSLLLYLIFICIMTLIHVGSFLSLLTPAIPLWQRFTAPPRTAATIAQAQERILRCLLKSLAPTVIGHRYGLAGKSTEDFRQQMPVLQYADLEAEVQRIIANEADVLFRGRPLALAQTSGTTRDAQACERFIPQSAALLRHHRRGGSAALARVLGLVPDVLRGRMLMLGGCTTLDRRGAVPVGDLSGICAAGLPGWIAGAYEPGRAIADEPNWERRLDRMAAHLASKDVTLASGIPAWLLMLFERLASQRGAPVSALWPRLRTVIHGGHAVEPFISTLGTHLDPSTWMQEVYPASEAFIAIGQQPWRLGDGIPTPLELLTDHGVYLEFATDSGAIVGAHELESGGIYRVLVTTPGGLLRYQVGDLVRAVGPGVVRFAGRIKTRISVFGEHVEGDALAAALAHAAHTTGSAVAHYHVAPLLPSPSRPQGAHEWFVEFAVKPSDHKAFTAALDGHLHASVLDYAAHRDGGQLLPPVLSAMPVGSFHAYLAAKGHLGGQHKVPQAWPDRTIADSLSQFSHISQISQFPGA